MYPKLIIDTSKVRNNIDAVAKIVKDDGCCSLMLVTKCLCADRPFCEILINHPRVDFLADSRVQNIKKYADLLKGTYKQSVLLRIPMLSEIEDLVKYVDISQNSEIGTIEAIASEARKQGKVHKILLMVDLGDLREGLFYQDEDRIIETAEKIHNLEGVELYGVSTNLTCYGAVIPKNDNLSTLCNIAKKIEDRLGIKLPVVSGGNSSSIYLIWTGNMPAGINNLRIGESYLLGNETAYGDPVPGTVHDAITLEAEIVEIQTKPSVPIGEIGMDAFGNTPEYEDRGIIKRAIIAIGQQDTESSKLIPFDEDIDVLGASSDHTILDVTKSAIDYKVGDTVKFKLDYGSLMKAATSGYVSKEYV